MPTLTITEEEVTLEEEEVTTERSHEARRRNIYYREGEARALYCDVYVTCAHIDDFFSVRANGS
jgi:hypothetical protein